jgi:hypothetical protein
MEENTPPIRQIDPLLKVPASGEAYKQLQGRIRGFRHNEVHGLKQRLRPDEVTSPPMPRNEGAHLVVSLVQALRGHRVLQVELTFPP